MAVRGSLHEMDLLNLLQMVCEERGSAELTLDDGSSHLAIYVADGQIVHAESDNRSGEDVFYEALGWKAGDFALIRDSPSPTVSIHGDWNNLLLEGLRRLDEATSHSEVAAMHTMQRTLLAVSDQPALLEQLRGLVAEADNDLVFVPTTSQAEAVSLLRQRPDVLLWAWGGPISQAGALVQALVQERAPIPTVSLISEPRGALPEPHPLNPVLFLAAPVQAAELAAALWAQIARQAPGALGGFPLFSLIEWVRVQGQSCLLTLRQGAQHGQLAFHEGNLVAGRLGPITGEEAMRALVRWDSPLLEIMPLDDTLAASTRRSPSLILRQGTLPTHPAIPNESSVVEDPLSFSGERADMPPAPFKGDTLMANTQDNITNVLSELMAINGAVAVAVVDLNSGMLLGKMGGADMDLEIAAAGNSEVVKAKHRVMRDLGIQGEIEDILITLGEQYHLIRPLGSDNSLFIYLVLTKAIANLALARRQLSKSESLLRL